MLKAVSKPTFMEYTSLMTLFHKKALKKRKKRRNSGISRPFLPRKGQQPEMPRAFAYSIRNSAE